MKETPGEQRMGCFPDPHTLNKKKKDQNNLPPVRTNSSITGKKTKKITSSIKYLILYGKLISSKEMIKIIQQI